MTNPVERTRLQALLAAANAHLENGWAARAAPLLREAEQLPMMRESAPNASSGAFHLAQARLLAVQGKMVAAKESFERAIRHFESDQPASALPLADACIEFGEMLQDHRFYGERIPSETRETAPDWIARGIRILESRPSNLPKIAGLCEKWLDSYYHFGRYQECVEVCLRMLAYLPESVDYGRQRAEAYGRLALIRGQQENNPVEAEQNFRSKIWWLEESNLHTEPDYHDALARLADCLMEQDRFDEAAVSLKKCWQSMLETGSEALLQRSYAPVIFDSYFKRTGNSDFRLADAVRVDGIRSNATSARRSGMEELHDLERILEPDDPQWLVEIAHKLGMRIFIQEVEDGAETRTNWLNRALSIGRTNGEWDKPTAEAWFRILDNCFYRSVVSAHLSEAEAILAELDGFLQAQPFLEKWDTLDLHLRLDLENGRIDEAYRKIEEDWNASTRCDYSKCERTYEFARLLEMYNHYSVAEHVIRKAIRLYDETNQDYSEGIDYYAVLARSLRGQGREAEAIHAETDRLSVVKRIGYKFEGELSP